MLPSEETIRWIIESSEWWIGEFGGFESFRQASLVRPVEDDFPVDLDLQGHDLVEDYFAFVVEHTGTREWPFKLVREDTVNVAAEVLKGIPHHETEAPSSFGEEEPQPILPGQPLTIPYDLAQLEDPVGLVATMAKGVSHYLLHRARQPPPGFDDDRELYVELGATYLGFGVFSATPPSTSCSTNTA